MENLKGENLVIEYPTNVENKMFVSISVMTYKHEKFIKQCLDGILMQQTNFDFEILIGEDDSPDKTREICKAYANKYPDKIRLFLHNRENVVYINGNPTGRFNFVYNLSKAKGKYIAICEGDDYWTDPLKLQKQVDFLEENKNFSLCFTNRINYDQRSATFIKAKPVKMFDFTLVDYLDKVKNGIVTATATSMFRAEILNEIDLNEFLEYSKKSGAADTFLFSIVLTKGKGKILKDITSVYRITTSGASSKFTNSLKYKTRITTYSFLLDKKLVKNPEDEAYIEEKLKELKKKYVKNKVLTFTHSLGLNKLVKKILNESS